MVLFDFSLPQTVASWHTENDVVMGGVSSSHFTHLSEEDNGEACGHFSGEVSLENDGGFAQILYDDKHFDLADSSGIELYVKGDGQSYQLRLETDDDKIAYAQSFVAKEAWHRVRLPFTNFEKTYNGEDRPDGPDLDLNHIRTVGLLIGDGQEGEFDIFVKRIETF